MWLKHEDEAKEVWLKHEDEAIEGWLKPETRGRDYRKGTET